MSTLFMSDRVARRRSRSRFGTRRSDHRKDARLDRLEQRWVFQLECFRLEL